jgi:hypothetical protein
MANRLRFPLLGTILATGVLLGSCDGGGPAPGSIALRWKLGFGVTCDNPAANIDTIKVKVLSPKNIEVISQSFTCSSGTGTVANVPVGTYNLTVEGGVGSSFTQPVFTGTLGGVVVSPGKVADVGTVVLQKLPPTENPGGMQVSWTFQTGLCGANGVKDVRLQVWRELVFAQHDKVYPCDIPAPGYVALDVPPTTYGVVADGMDANGKIVRSGSKSDVTVQAGTTTTVVIQLLPVQ